MAHRLAYPVDLERQNGGSVLVSFPDIPEALAEGATEEEALAEAEDCLVAALGGYIRARRAVPRPSPGRGRALVPLPALVAAKTALYSAMRVEGVGNTALAERPGVTEGAVRPSRRPGPPFAHRSGRGGAACAGTPARDRDARRIGRQRGATLDARHVAPPRCAVGGTRARRCAAPDRRRAAAPSRGAPMSGEARPAALGARRGLVLGPQRRQGGDREPVHRPRRGDRLPLRRQARARLRALAPSAYRRVAAPCRRPAAPLPRP